MLNHIQQRDGLEIIIRKIQTVRIQDFNIMDTLALAVLYSFRRNIHPKRLVPLLSQLINQKTRTAAEI